MKKTFAMLLLCGGTLVMASAFESKPISISTDNGYNLTDTVPKKKGMEKNNKMRKDSTGRSMKDSMRTDSIR